MDFGLAMLLAAFAGGLFGAAIGGLPAFIFTGIAVLIGVGAAVAGGEFDILTNLAFGPVFGPHIAFAGGAAAAAYAARRGDLENGRDIAAPMAGMNDPIVLIVGAVFGLGGYVFQQLLVGIGIGGYTDSVAFTVFVSGIVARVAFGNTGVFGSLTSEARQRGRMVPGGDQVWVDYQQGFGQAIVLGLGSGLLASWIVVAAAEINPDLAGPATFAGFGISALSLILLQTGFQCPVTHHMTLPGALACAGMVAIGAPPVAALLLGAAAGIGGALLGEVFSRLFLIHGDTHIDPPAGAIFVMTTLVIVIGLFVG